jgi:hypothetical protein
LVQLYYFGMNFILMIGTRENGYLRKIEIWAEGLVTDL